MNRVAIVGGGNIGHALTAYLGLRGVENTVLTRRAQEWSEALSLHLPNQPTRSVAVRATSNPASALAGADIVLVALPANVRSSVLPTLATFVSADMAIGFVPAAGAYELHWQMHAPAESIGQLFAFQRVPFISRTRRYGAEVEITGLKPEVFISARESDVREAACKFTESALGIDAVGLSSPLETTISTSNPILHTARLHTLFSGHPIDMVYPENPLFYESWDQASSDLLVGLDQDVQSLTNSLPIELTSVVSILKHYEVENAIELTQKIRSIPAFRGIRSPMLQLESGWRVDLTSRYFQEDILYGLLPMKALADLTGATTPHFINILNWASAAMGHDLLDSFGAVNASQWGLPLPHVLGITDIEKLI